MKNDPDSNPVVFWCCAIVGGAISLYGLHGLVGALHGVRSRQFIQWFVGADLAHDLVVAPAACVIGGVIARVVPGPAHAHVRAGVFASAIVIAIAWAPLHAYGHATAPGNSSVEPLNYATAVPTVLAMIWAFVGGWFAVTALRARRSSRQPASTP